MLANEADPVAVGQYWVEADQPLHVQPISTNGGVARFQVKATLPAGVAEFTGKVTVRIASIANESAVVVVTARRIQP